MKPEKIKLRSYSFAAAAVWFILLGLSLIWNLKNEKSGAVEVARIVAHTAFEKDVVYRRWNAKHGGVYAPVNETTRPNPYLDVPERDIVTPSDKKLTKINPAYMTRQVHEIGKDALGIEGHITSLNPIRPENAPTLWETQALKTFETGADEFTSVEEIQGGIHLRFMRPLLAEKECLKCHAAQGYKVGDIRGGISISVPMAPFNAIARKQIITLLIVHGCLFLIGIVGIVFTVHHLNRQIDMRIKTENELKESEEKFRQMFETMNNGVAVYEAIADGQDFILKNFNTGAERIENVKREAVIGKRVTTAFPRIQEFGLLDVLKRVWRTGEAENHPLSFYRDNRLAGWRENFVYKLQSGEVVTIYDDITERKQAEDELRESEGKYRFLVENANDAIFVAQDGVIKFPNQRTEKFLGYSERELAEMPFIDFIHPDDRETVFGRHKRRLRGEKSVSTYSFRIIHKSGLERIVQINTAFFQWEDRPATLNFLRDITHQAELEEQLRQAQKMESIGTLAGGIAHDFNNILSSVIGYTELSLLDAQEGTPLHNNLQEVFNAGIRAKDLVKQILAFSRQAEQELKPVQVKLIVKETLKLLRASLPTTIEIQQNIQSDETVLADATQIHQILMNLCTNAGHAIGEEVGTLKVGLSCVELDTEFAAKNPEILPGVYQILSVSDTGHGISTNEMEKIFDPFYTTKKPDEGTGMGLSVVHGIVKSHGGAIKVYSEHGKGSTFNVYLPIIEPKIEPKVRVEGALPKGSEHILFVDDEKPLVDIGKRILEQHGYRVTTRTSSIEALELFKAKPDDFDLVVTDMTMPNMTGQKLASEIVQIRADIPTILYSGYTPKISQESAEALGIRAFINKPILKAELLTKVRKVLDYI